MKKNSDSNVLVIGLDGATWKVINPLLKKGKLPFLASLVKGGMKGISLGSIPPLTPSVWTSFLTGVNPGKHKIFGFLNYRANPEKPPFFTTRDIAYPTIDKVLKENKKESYISFKSLSGLIDEAGIETKQVKLEDLLNTARQKVKKLKRASSKKKLSFAFILFKEVDVAQHLFWGNPTLADFLEELDKILADLVVFWRQTHSQSLIVVVSDHGFHAAPHYQFSIYPWLTGTKHPKISLWSVLHLANKCFKKIGINLVQLTFMQKTRKRLVRKTETNSATDIISQKGIQASFEGLYLYDQNIDKGQLVKSFKKLKYLGEKVFQLVSLADGVYKGAFWNGGPDIVWIPSPFFHINISPLAEDIFSPHPTDVTGDHTADRKGIYILSQSPLKKQAIFPPILSISDLTATIYDFLKITKPLGLDGASLLADYSDLDKKIKKAKAIFVKAYGKFGNNFGVAFTGRKDSTVMVHMLLQLVKEKKHKLPRFLFLDHGQHFPESLAFLRKTVKVLGIQIVWKKIKGENFSASDLAVAKAKALTQAVAGNGWLAIATAIRRDENPTRSLEKFFSPREGHVRIHPMLEFTESDIWEYLKRFKVPYNPLYDKGYRSLEEKGTTQIVTDYTKNERAGRDQKKEKIMSNLRKLGYF